MHSIASDCLATLSAHDIARFRLASMVAVLVVGLLSGYLASTQFQEPKRLAKTIMTVVLVGFNWLIALLVIWRLQLSRQLIWLPIVGAVLMLTVTALSAGLFSFLKLDRSSRLTLILAAALSNLGYTGGAFICYALFGAEGLGLANIYLLLWLPTLYLVFLPILKIHQLRIKDSNAKLNLKKILDFRFLALPAVITALTLNLTNVKTPDFVAKSHIVDILVYVASGLSFFAIGLQVNLARLKNYINLYFPLAAVKFVLTPAVALLLIWLLKISGRNLTSLVQNVIIVLSVTPSAIFMVTLSNVFDLDGPLASALWVVTTAAFVVLVVPVLFLLFA